MGNSLSRLGRTIRGDRQDDPVQFSRNQNESPPESSSDESFQFIEEVPVDEPLPSTSYWLEHQPSIPQPVGGKS